jgi:hypothetical protein
MVDRTGAQLYTIEGFAAALIMLVTAWVVLGTTTMYTPGDSHISDMQLEQLGNDVLFMMDTPANFSVSGKSPLQSYIENKDGQGTLEFDKLLRAYCNERIEGPPDTIQYNASVYYRDRLDNQTKSFQFNRSRNIFPGDHAVRVTHWVLVNNTFGGAAAPSDVLNNRPQTVLLEVFLWRT